MPRTSSWAGLLALASLTAMLLMGAADGGSRQAAAPAAAPEAARPACACPAASRSIQS